MAPHSTKEKCVQLQVLRICCQMHVRVKLILACYSMFLIISFLTVPWRCFTWSFSVWLHDLHGSWGDADGVGASGRGGLGGGFGFFQPISI